MCRRKKSVKWKRATGSGDQQLPELCGRIEAGKKLEMSDRDHIMDKIKPAIGAFLENLRKECKQLSP